MFLVMNWSWLITVYAQTALAPARRVKVERMIGPINNGMTTGLNGDERMNMKRYTMYTKKRKDERQEDRTID